MSTSKDEDTSDAIRCYIRVRRNIQIRRGGGRGLAGLKTSNNLNVLYKGQQKTTTLQLSVFTFLQALCRY